ncbi:unnamed protein product [Caenorhabditis sp. 36 PRJEB53466]|nr:unnamed protein product [Caenorhabditis sp. 36 PRJEB53466]
MPPSYQIIEHDVPQSYRDEILKWNGWGYTDSQFAINKQGHVTFTGKKYDISGKVMPHFRPWFENYLGIDLDFSTPTQKLSDVVIDAPIESEDIIEFLRENSISFSNAPKIRLMRGHGHTVHDMVNLREGKIPRLPDIVVWPKTEQDIVKIIEGAMSHNCAIIPIGGGTSVTNALDCPTSEKRAILSLDMALLDTILWIDRENLTCRAQAGIIGQSLEQQLNKKGFTCGHEPDSIEFSTLGGWVSTRASGMKKNKYGNIEDLVVHINFVCPKGIIQKQCQVPRISSGPDIHQIILGSEGTLGVVSEVTIKIFPLAEAKRYGSFVFPNFEHGVNFFPTCVYEGTYDEVVQQEDRLNKLAADFHGVVGGEENGQYGYRLTFAIAYLRDLGMNHGVLGESFETSVPWDKVLSLCRNVKDLMRREAKNQGVKHPVLASCRVTQVYDAGACVYFYFGFNAKDLPNGLQVYDRIETAARDEIIACGGSISHHHGVGKIRKQWMLTTNGAVGIALLKAIKSELDPANIFASANLIDIIGLPPSEKSNKQQMGMDFFFSYSTPPPSAQRKAEEASPDG